MSRIFRCLFLLAFSAAGLVPVTAAAAQWYGNAGAPPPLYPYELQPGQSYAVEVAPGTYVIHRPSDRYAYPAAAPRVRHNAVRHRAAFKPKKRKKPKIAPKIAPKRTHADRALIEELRRRDARRAAKLAAKRTAAAERAAKRAAERAAKRAARHADKYAGRKPDRIVNTRKIVREKPLVIETRRVVNDPPRVITRRHYVDDAPPPRLRRRHVAAAARPPDRDENPRVIHADAEITILGPDRMSIRLVRKQGQPLDDGAHAPKHIKKRIKKRK